MQPRQFISTLAVAFVAISIQSGAADQGRQRDQDARGRQMRFRAMDRDGDGVITRAEWRGNLQSFRQHDRNRDGVLSGDEVWVGAEDTDRGAGGNQDLASVFRSTDRDGDGTIARDEWYGDLATFERVDRNDDGRIALSEFLGEDPQGESRQSFAEMDRNRNGVLTLSEWPGTRAEFRSLDTDEDGVITRAEYLARDEATRSPAYRSGHARGLAEGRQAGQEDRTVNGGRWDLEGQRELEQADSGYNPSMGSRADYQAGYRAGFRRGYEQGFGRR